MWEQSIPKGYHLPLVGQPTVSWRLWTKVSMQDDQQHRIQQQMWQPCPFDPGELVHNIQRDAGTNRACTRKIASSCAWWFRYDAGVCSVDASCTHAMHLSDLAPSDYALFNKIMDAVRGQHIQSSAELHAIVHRSYTQNGLPKISGTSQPNGWNALTWLEIIYNLCTIHFLLVNCILPCDIFVISVWPKYIENLFDSYFF